MSYKLFEKNLSDFRHTPSDSEGHANTKPDVGVSGFYIVDFLPAKILTIGSAIYNDYVWAVDSVNNIKTNHAAIKKFLQKNNINRYIFGIDEPDDSMSVVGIERTGLNDISPGSVGVDQTCTLQLYDSPNFEISNLLQVWAELLYSKVASRTLLNYDYYRKSQYAGKITVSAMKPNLEKPAIYSKSFLNVFPTSIINATSKHSNSESKVVELSVTFAYEFEKVNNPNINLTADMAKIPIVGGDIAINYNKNISTGFAT